MTFKALRIRFFYILLVFIDPSSDGAEGGRHTRDHRRRESGAAGSRDHACACGGSSLQPCCVWIHQRWEVACASCVASSFVLCFVQEWSLCLFLVRRIVCDMEESLMSSPPGGPVELCIGDCSAEYRTQSSQIYSFVVRPLLCLGKGLYYFKTSWLCLKLEECCLMM